MRIAHQQSNNLTVVLWIAKKLTLLQIADITQSVRARPRATRSSKMTTLSDPGNSNPVEEAFAKQVLELVVDALLDVSDVYQEETSRRRYLWPKDGQIVVSVPNLPEDPEPIKAAIRTYAGHVGDDGHIRFSVKEVEVDREAGRIRIIGDPSRITSMRPLPKR